MALPSFPTEKEQAMLPPVIERSNSGKCDSGDGFDIFMGRSKEAFKNPGNVKFRQIVHGFGVEYHQSSSRRAKSDIVFKAWSSVLKAGGRFCDFDPTGQSPTHLAPVADTKICIAKIGHALRDYTKYRRVPGSPPTTPPDTKLDTKKPTCVAKREKKKQSVATTNQKPSVDSIRACPSSLESAFSKTQKKSRGKKKKTKKQAHQSSSPRPNKDRRTKETTSTKKRSRSSTAIVTKPSDSSSTSSDETTTPKETSICSPLVEFILPAATSISAGALRVGPPPPEACGFQETKRPPTRMFSSSDDLAFMRSIMLSLSTSAENINDDAVESSKSRLFDRQHQLLQQEEEQAQHSVCDGQPQEIEDGAGFKEKGEDIDEWSNLSDRDTQSLLSLEEQEELLSGPIVMLPADGVNDDDQSVSSYSSLDSYDIPSGCCTTYDGMVLGRGDDNAGISVSSIEPIPIGEGA